MTPIIIGGIAGTPVGLAVGTNPTARAGVQAHPQTRAPCPERETMTWLNTNEAPPETSGARVLMDPGKYVFELVDHDFTSTRSGKGKRVPALFECVDARYPGAKIKHNWNIINDSEMAVNISKREIFDIAVALGIDLLVEDPFDIPRELNRLMNQPILCEIGIEKGKGTFTNKEGEEVERHDRNRIVAFMKYDPAASEAEAPSATPQKRERLSR